MKILLTTWNLREIAGSKTYAETIAAALPEHDVTVGSLHGIVGPMGLRMKRVATCLPYPLWGRYDVGIVSGPETFSGARCVCDRVVYISHGIVDGERPMPGADAYVAVSEEVAEHWDWPESPVILRNPINLETHVVSPRVPAEQVRSVAYISNYDDIPWLSGACQDLGVEFVRCKHTPDLVGPTNDADLVIAAGRSCYEAMARGREVLIMDNRNYHGGILADGIASWIYFGARTRNCSGRMNRSEPTVERFRSTLSVLDPRTGGRDCRAYIEAYHDSRVIASSLLGLVA